MIHACENLYSHQSRQQRYLVTIPFLYIALLITLSNRLDEQVIHLAGTNNVTNEYGVFRLLHSPNHYESTDFLRRWDSNQ